MSSILKVLFIEPVSLSGVGHGELAWEDQVRESVEKGLRDYLIKQALPLLVFVNVSTCLINWYRSFAGDNFGRREKAVIKLEVMLVGLVETLAVFGGQEVEKGPQFRFCC